MICPHCQMDSKSPVMETRAVKGEVFRRRGCGQCGKAFVSIETAPPKLRMPEEASTHARAEGYQARKRPALTTLNWKPPK